MFAVVLMCIDMRGLLGYLCRMLGEFGLGQVHIIKQLIYYSNTTRKSYLYSIHVESAPHIVLILIHCAIYARISAIHHAA